MISPGRRLSVTRAKRLHFGRQDVLVRLDEWLDEWLDGPDEAGWVVVTGGPGMGKSASLAAWLARREV